MRAWIEFMQRHRSGEEKQPTPPRSDRFYKLGDDWYFQVRGGASFGPYSCRAEADRAAREMFNSPEVSESREGTLIHPNFSRWKSQQS